ncbi:MAG: hypothetical protein IT322_08020 [Anaerolineae bacterium]|nr:hypothetical protein [Anaerolineae bacterium]
MDSNYPEPLKTYGPRVEALLVTLGQQWGGDNVNQNISMPLNFPKLPDEMSQMSPDQLQAWAAKAQEAVKKMEVPSEWQQEKKRFEVVHKERRWTLYLWYGTRATFIDEDVYDSYKFIKGDFAYVTIWFNPYQHLMWEFSFRKPQIHESLASFEALESTLRSRWSELVFEA